MITIAKKLKFRGTVYEFSHAKDNILTYISQPYHYYDDWEGDGGILVVKYRNVTNEKDIKDRYVVLHEMKVSYGRGYISEENISKSNKIPEIVKD